MLHTTAETLTVGGPEMTLVLIWNPFLPAKEVIMGSDLRATNILFC